MVHFSLSRGLSYRSDWPVFTNHDWLKGLTDKPLDATPKEDPVEQPWFQLSKISHYCLSFFRRMIFISKTTLLIIKKAYTNYCKGINRVAPALILKVSENEDKLLAAFNKLKSHSSYLLLVKISERKDLLLRDTNAEQKTFQLLKSRLYSNISYGITSALLSRILSTPRAPSSELLAFINIENIFYLEMLHQMEISLLIEKTRKSAQYRIGRALLVEDPQPTPETKIESEHLFSSKPETEKVEPMVMKKPSLMKVVEETKNETEKLMEACQKINTDLHSHKKSEIFEAYKPLEIYQETLAKLCSPNLEPQGHVLIFLPEPTSPEKTQKFASYSIFFQCVPGQFRFYIHTEGFYVYSNKIKFINALREQILSLGENVKVQFSI